MNAEISDAQIGNIVRVIDHIVVTKFTKASTAKKNKTKLFLKILEDLHNHFDVGSLCTLEEHQLEEILHWLDNHVKGLVYSKDKDLNKFERCKALVKRAKKELNLNQAKILNFAYYRLPLSQRIYSLDRLQEQDLLKLEKLLFEPEKNPTNVEITN